MPRAVLISMWLFLGGIAAGFVLNRFEPTTRWPNTPSVPVLIAAIVLAVAAVCALAFIALRTYQGRNWARWTQLFLLVVGLPEAIWQLLGQVAVAPIMTSFEAVVLCSQIVAVAFLFTPTSNLWYRRANSAC